MAAALLQAQRGGGGSVMPLFVCIYLHSVYRYPEWDTNRPLLLLLLPLMCSSYVLAIFLVYLLLQEVLQERRWCYSAGAQLQDGGCESTQITLATIFLWQFTILKVLFVSIWSLRDEMTVNYRKSEKFLVLKYFRMTQWYPKINNTRIFWQRTYKMMR